VSTDIRRIHARALPEALRLRPVNAAAARGLALCLGIAACAQVVGSHIPVIGAPLVAILLGVAITNLLGRARSRFQVGEISKGALKCGIVLLGGALDLRDVLHTGASSLLVLVFTIMTGMSAAFWLGARAGVSWRLRCLIGIGTTICGASAIAALAPVVRAMAEEITYSISAVFLLNMVAVILFPVLGHALALSDHGFGLWAGTAINDTSAVVAAAFAYSHDAGNYAIIVKLTRTTLIIPLVIGFGLATRQFGVTVREETASIFHRARKAVPWFVALFFAASLLNTFGVVGRLAPDVQLLGRLVLLVALAGVGLQGHWRAFSRAGPRPLLLGVTTWAVVAASSLAVQGLMGAL
jgi:uncharacterized integral membrane protein (TIGR00698 family)